MKFTKPALTVDEQADRLIQRGMQGNRAAIIDCLSVVSYYRLSGYWYPFREPNPADPRTPQDQFKPNTTFDEVWTRYTFDRRVRLLVMDAIERIEVAVRCHLANEHSLRHGLFAYADDPASLPLLRMGERTAFLQRLEEEQDRSKDAFAKHFRTKYGSHHSSFPVWMALEVMSFGTLLTFHRGSPQDIQKSVAAVFGVHDTVFASWLLALNVIRNICAHHGRLWNRELGVKPKIPQKLPDWHNPVEITDERVFGILTICKWSLDRIAPQSGWAGRCRALIAEAQASRVPIVSMGFPSDWERSPIWAR